jgi:prefoldin subunit 5
MTSSDSKVAKIQTHFQALSEVASSLNIASDELTKTVTILDEALKKLNLGLTVWVSFRRRGDDDEPHLYDDDQIGYCKINGVWGIALRRIWGDESWDRHSEDGPWLFNDASREMRLHSVDSIPNVIEALAKEAFDTTKRIQEKTKEVGELAGAIGQVANAEKKRTKPPSPPAPPNATQQGPLQPPMNAKAVPLDTLLGKSNEGVK